MKNRPSGTFDDPLDAEPLGRPSGADDQDPPTIPIRDRRSAPRFIFQVPVLLRVGHQSGRGKVHDMSSTGARIENANLEPTEGAKIRLGFRFFENSPPIELNADVVRKTQSGGFCVHFRAVDQRTRRALTTLLPKLGSGRFEQVDSRMYTGELVARLGADVHRACAEAAQAANMPLNDWIKARLRDTALQEMEEARTETSPAPYQGGSSRNPYRR